MVDEPKQRIREEQVVTNFKERASKPLPSRLQFREARYEMRPRLRPEHDEHHGKRRSKMPQPTGNPMSSL
jgi:hypothetical protein